MTVLSLLRHQPLSTCLRLVGGGSNNVVQQLGRNITTSAVRNGGGHDRTMAIIPSRYQWEKYKDLFHFYFMLGAIPCLAIVFYVDVFIGPATLEEIPKGYRPKHWEYERHPISRFMRRYMIACPQQVYERNMFYLNEQDESVRIQRLEKKVRELMQERGDYPNWYTNKFQTPNYARNYLLEQEYIKSVQGEE